MFENKRVQKGRALNIVLSKPESPFLNLPYKEYQELKSYANFLKEPLGEDPDYQKQLLLPSNIEYVKIEDCDSFKDIVKKHNFKGFCIYFNCNKVKTFNRDFIELLYYINSTVALSSNKEKTIAILKGGLSAEYDISNKSAHSVKLALEAKGYNVLEVNVDNEFLSIDSLEFRKHMETVTPDINMTTKIMVDGEETEVTIPVTVRFFWPST